MEVGLVESKLWSSGQEMRGGSGSDKAGEVDVRIAMSKCRNVRCIAAIERAALGR